MATEHDWQKASEEWRAKRLAEHEAAMKADAERQKRDMSHVSEGYVDRKYRR
jgi:hypothetical protein